MTPPRTRSGTRPRRRRRRGRRGPPGLRRGSPRAARFARRLRRRCGRRRRARGAGPAGRRAASQPELTQRFPPTVAWPRISGSARSRAAVASGSSPSWRSEMRTPAPIVTLPPSRCDAVEPRREQHDTLRPRAAVDELRDEHRSAREHDRACAVAEALDELLRRPRPDHLGCGSRYDGHRGDSDRIGARLAGYSPRRGVPDDRGARGRPPPGRLPARPRPLHRTLPRRPAREAAAPRRRGRRREDRGRKGARDVARRAADPAPVLRGPRHRARGLRVELPPPAPAHPRGPGGHRHRGGALRARVSDPPPAPRGDRERGAGRAPDRRDRPRRRRVRGLPPRGALGLPDHDPRDRHGARRSAVPPSCSPRTERASSTTR